MRLLFNHLDVGSSCKVVGCQTRCGRQVGSRLHCVVYRPTIKRTKMRRPTAPAQAINTSSVGNRCNVHTRSGAFDVDVSLLLRTTLPTAAATQPIGSPHANNNATNMSVPASLTTHCNCASTALLCWTAKSQSNISTLAPRAWSVPRSDRSPTHRFRLPTGLRAPTVLVG